MALFESIIRIFDATAEIPLAYGSFHVFCLTLCLIATIAACIWGPRLSEKTIRRIVLGVALTVIALEVYKQLCYTFDLEEGGITAEFQWYAFPWQFCSTPMYVGLLAGLTKKGRIHDSACAFLSTYAIFAGISVMLIPGDVFMDIIGINIQTMVCHGTMLPVGALLLASGHVERSHKTILKALPVFITAVGIAVLLNEHAFQTGLLENHNFNMFFISPYCEPSLLVYSEVQRVVPFPYCLMIYVAGFTLAAYIVLLAAMGIGKLAKALAPKHKVTIT